MARTKSTAREYLEALLIAVVFATFARTYVIQAFKIPTGSMEQNLLIGDHILVNKFIYAPRVFEFEERWLPLRGVQRGDVVVFKFPRDPSRDFIKRCLGLPGDNIEMVGKELIVNGQEVRETGYVHHTDPQVYPRSLFLHENYRNRDNLGPFAVPAGNFFCLGDNRDNSNDSRFWGPVPAAFVKGRAFLVYWSYDGSPASIQTTGLLGKARAVVQVAASFFSHTRWSRSFRLVR
jgi:signal peptidase I